MFRCTKRSNLQFYNGNNFSGADGCPGRRGRSPTEKYLVPKEGKKQYN